MKQKRKFSLLAASLALATLLAGCGATPAGNNAVQAAAEPASTAQPAPTQAPTPAPSPTVTSLRFSATGDNLIHDGLFIQASARAGGNGYDFDYCYQNVKDFYSQFDINWINQETLVNDVCEPSGYPCFSTPGALGKAAYDAGFRVFSLSNNHSYDKLAAGIAGTRAFWASMPEDVSTCGFYAGPDDYSNITIQEKDGVKIAYLAYTQHTNGIPTPQGAEANIIYTDELEVIEAQIEQARTQADLVIVGNHWGTEGSHTVEDYQRVLAQQEADWGADVIIGTHPHVVQDAEWLTSADGRPVFVAYSLGNFINLQSNADNMIGMVLDFTIQKTTQADGSSQTEILSPVFHPVVSHYDAHYANGRVYMFDDYTDDLAASHGIRGSYPGFNRAYIEQVMRENVSEEFLAL